MPDQKIFYSEKLNLKYRIMIEESGLKRIIFEDNVNYRQNEMEKIKKCSVDQIKMIHAIKLTFEGVII